MLRKIISIIVLVAIVSGAVIGVRAINNKAVADANVDENKEEVIEEKADIPQLVWEQPVATPVPVAEVEVEVTVEVDRETGKTYYSATSEAALLEYIWENVSAEDAVDAVECVYYGASMVVSHDDERVIGGITAYDLVDDEAIAVEFNHNGKKLYAFDAYKNFSLDSDGGKTFKDLKPSRAYKAWICEKHDAVRESALVYEGYPEAEGYRATFSTEEGFDVETLKAVVLIHTE